LDETRLLRIVPQGGSDLTDAGVDPQVEVDVRVSAPELFPDLLTRDEIPLPLDQKDEQLGRLGIELHRPPVAGQRAGLGVDREIRKPNQSHARNLQSRLFLGRDYTQADRKKRPRTP
jgi:hypothetical protein